MFCLGKSAGWIATPTCNIQFNTDPSSHDDWINNPPEINTDITPTPGPPPVARPPANERVPHGSGGRLNGKETSIVIAVVVAFILVVGEEFLNEVRLFMNIQGRVKLLVYFFKGQSMMLV